MTQNATLSTGIKLLSLWYLASGLTGLGYLVAAAFSPERSFVWSSVSMYEPMFIVGGLLWWFEASISRILGDTAEPSNSADVTPLRVGLIILGLYFFVNALTKLGYVIPLQIAQS